MPHVQKGTCPEFCAGAEAFVRTAEARGVAADVVKESTSPQALKRIS